MALRRTDFPAPTSEPAAAAPPSPVVDGAAPVPVLFRMAADHLNCTTVHLVAEFNGWSPTATPMTKSGSEYAVTVALTPGRAYRYKFLVDGTQWENDWHADGYAPNEFGGEDSLLDLTMGGPGSSQTPTGADDPDSPGAAIDDTDGPIPEPNEPG